MKTFQVVRSVTHTMAVLAHTEKEALSIAFSKPTVAWEFDGEEVTAEEMGESSTFLGTLTEDMI